MIAQGFGFTGDFLKERNNSAYFRLKEIPCEFKEQARARHPGEKCGLGQAGRREYSPSQCALRRPHDCRDAARCGVPIRRPGGRAMQRDAAFRSDVSEQLPRRVVRNAG